MNYILYNPHSGHGKSIECAEKINKESEVESTVIDMTSVDYPDLMSKLTSDDVITILGGDGTLNRFVNETDGLDNPARLFYYPSGTGNDFYADLSSEQPLGPIEITELMKGLPTVTVDGADYKFINGVGYGIDGYCCEVGDKMHAEGKVPNYTSIAIKGLLFHFKPRNATVIVDGVEKTYKKVWIAPTMFGRHYGGGMIPTPEQDRYAEDREVSLMVFHGSSKLKTLMIFPSIFKGEHIKNEKYVTVMRGKEITVEFDRPTALQIDGETILGVTKYSVSADAKVKINN
jgi:diacylglycerol kinase family enzyme